MSSNVADNINTDSRLVLGGTIPMWESLRQDLEALTEKRSAETLFGDAAGRGRVYRWGIAASTGSACDATLDLLSRMACGARLSKRPAKTIDVAASAEAFAAQLGGTTVLAPVDATAAILWAAALPALTAHLEQDTWWRLVKSLQQVHEAVLQCDQASSPEHLMLGGELGLTLAWRLECLPACVRLRSSSIEAIKAWCHREDESVSAAISSCTDARLVLASFIRCRWISNKICNRKARLSKRQLSVGRKLAVWVAAMTTHTGGTALSPATGKDVRDDLPPDGLLAHAAEFDRDALEPAIAAALGKTQTGGRLVWQVGLPASIHHDVDAKVAVMFPDWDVRRGRTHIDYSGQEPKIELFAGRAEVIAGVWQTLIEVDDQEQQASGAWDEVCEYSDDDVHYLEIEQEWTGGVVLQRQIMLIRDDRCLLLADAVLPSCHQDEHQATALIKYSSRLPLCPSIEIEPEQDTREVFLNDGRRRGLVIPLSAAEWRMGPTNAVLKASEDDHLLLAAEGRGRLYAPLWFDFQRRRFKRKRTWRELTITDQLRIVRRDEATGYRVQVGSEQWAVYRSLAGPRCRSVLGKHLISDFFCSRFDPSDGSHDELVTVDDNQPEDE